MMEELRDLKESVKAIHVQLPAIAPLTERFNVLEAQQKAVNADINARLLCQEEEIKNLKSSLNDAHSNHRTYKASVNKLAVDFGRLSDEVSNIQHSIAAVQENASDSNVEKLVSMNSTIVQLSDQITDLFSKQETSDIRLQQLQKSEQDVAVEQSWQRSSNNTAAARADDTERKGSSTDYVFNSQVLLFVHDSNGHRVKGEILQFNTTVQKYSRTLSPKPSVSSNALLFTRSPRR